MTVVVLGFTAFIAIVFPSIVSIINIVGGYGGTSVSYTHLTLPTKRIV